MATATAPIHKPQMSGVIKELRVQPQEGLHVFLGRFELPTMLKGFAIEVRPSTVPEEAVTAKITRMDGESGTKFFLDIANKGVRNIKARIHAI